MCPAVCCHGRPSFHGRPGCEGGSGDWICMAGGLDRSPGLTREAVLASTGRAGIHETGLSLDKTILVTARAARCLGGWIRVGTDRKIADGCTASQYNAVGVRLK